MKKSEFRDKLFKMERLLKDFALSGNIRLLEEVKCLIKELKGGSDEKSSDSTERSDNDRGVS